MSAQVKGSLRGDINYKGKGNLNGNPEHKKLMGRNGNVKQLVKRIVTF
jgi:hypothetical protein